MSYLDPDNLYNLEVAGDNDSNWQYEAQGVDVDHIYHVGGGG